MPEEPHDHAAGKAPPEPEFTLMLIADAATELGKLPGYLFLLLGVAAADPGLALRALGLLAAGECLCLGLKQVFRVERPVTGTEEARPASRFAANAGYSFPSCHALNGAATLGFLATQTGNSVVAMLLALLLGVIVLSRLVLRHHRPIDVVAGLALGTGLQMGAVAAGW
jgi:membrane-associated phospholipid phosphatase